MKNCAATGSDRNLHGLGRLVGFAPISLASLAGAGTWPTSAARDRPPRATYTIKTKALAIAIPALAG